MKRKHTLIIIRLILSTDLALIQLKDSHFNSSFSQHGYTFIARYISRSSLQQKKKKEKDFVTRSQNSKHKLASIIGGTIFSCIEREQEEHTQSEKI